MNDEHIDACMQVNCDSRNNKTHCCTRYDLKNQIEAYCCDVDEFIDKHLMPSIPHEEHDHPYVPEIHYVSQDKIETTTMPTTQSTESTTESNTNNARLATQATEHHIHPEPHALGWTFLGITSGVIVLLLFIAVVLGILYIFYHWRKKYGREGRQAYYQRACGQEVVVFRHANSQQQHETTTLSSDPQVICTTSSNNNDNSDDQPPPPYSSFANKPGSSHGESNNGDRRNSTKEKLYCTLPEP